MQIAILGFSIIGAVTGTASLLIMAKTARELQIAKTHVETKIAGVEAKVEHNKKVVKTAIAQLEF